VAQRIADLTGGTPFDGFKSKADFNEIAVAVIDCGGTARVGVYPMKGVLTIDVHSTSPSGPLMKYIKETNFVSGVTVDNITLLDDCARLPKMNQNQVAIGIGTHHQRRRDGGIVIGGGSSGEA